MELKLEKHILHAWEIARSNRTFMELKFEEFKKIDNKMAF